MDALDVGASTGDFARATAVFAPSCESCKRGIAYAQGIYAQGQKIVGGHYENPKFGVNKSPVGDVVVSVNSTVAAFKVVDAKGKTVGRSDAEKNVSNFHLKKSGNGWHVVEWSYSS